MTFKIAEPTLSPEVANLLSSFLGCKIASEGVLPDRKQFDFFLLLDSFKIIIELKIGGFDKLPYAISQGESYKDRVGADGIIAIVYPNEARKDVTRPEDVIDVATNISPTAMVLCPFLKDYFPKISLADLADNLKKAIAKPKVAPSISLAVETLRQSVEGIAIEIKRSVGIDHPVIKETVGSLALFDILSEEAKEAGISTSKEATKSVVADLAAYILVNQILLHHILADSLSLPRKLKPIASPAELNAYFKEIEAIDYKAVYCVDIASTIPITATNEINTAMIAIRVIQPENLGHDLLGRIFHEFLPPETRKQLGTFYTRPQAAELLAGLSIDKADAKVLDPACGSGTLLVAAYRNKKAVGRGQSHRKMVEEEITGIDIMPFAAHLAALNLTMQSPKEVTNRTRIGIGSSLNMTPGNNVGSLSKWVKTFGGDITGVCISHPEEKGEAFELEPVDLVIMNPPFTRKERLTSQMKGVRFQSLGNQNYWAYFVAFADSILKDRGKIAAVLPRDFFRGQYSRLMREYLFKDRRFSIRYIVKSVRDWAFSENALFRDFLLILEKDNSEKKCCLVYIKRSVSDIGLEDANHIAQSVRLTKENETFEDDSFTVSWVNQNEILSNWQDLGHLVVFNTRSGDSLIRFYEDALLRAGDRLTSLKKQEFQGQILRGLEPTVENLLDLVFVVRPLCERRVGHSSLIVSGVKENEISAIVKKMNIPLRIPKHAVKLGLKTAAYLNKLDVQDISDFAILKPFDGIEKAQTVLGIEEIDFRNISERANDRLAHVLVSRRFDFTSPGTRAVSFFSSEKLLPGKAFWALPSNLNHSKILCIWLNSTFSLIESLLSHTETRGSFIELTKEKLLEFHIPDVNTCDTKYLLDAFEQIRNDELPPLVQQFDHLPESRLIIDRAVLKTIGYDDTEIDELLPDLYAGMAVEMRTLLELMHKSVSKERVPDLQLHLIPKD